MMVRRSGTPMPLFRWIPMLACTLVLAQDVPFAEEARQPWAPLWELTARAESIRGILGDGLVPMGDIRREGLQIRLRWKAEWGGLDWTAGLRSAAGTDGNSGNRPRWDQQPSNGTQLDVARVELAGLSRRLFGRVTLGFQELGLLTSQAMWDADLRFLGASASGGFREGPVQEASARTALGRVRTVYPRNDVDLAAFQAVLKLGYGAFSAVLHADRWNLAWTADEGRFSAPDFRGDGRQRLVLDGAGGSVKWEGPVPLEARWSGTRERATRETGEEFQVLAGGRARPFRPQVAYTWQRLSSTGEFYVVNSDQWWYYRGAKGPRVDLILPLRGLWSVSLVHLRQSIRRSPVVAEKTMLTVQKRF